MIGKYFLDKNGKIKVSKFIEEIDKKFLHIQNDIKLLKLENQHKLYLEYHNDKILIK